MECEYPITRAISASFFTSSPSLRCFVMSVLASIFLKTNSMMSRPDMTPSWFEFIDASIFVFFLDRDLLVISPRDPRSSAIAFSTILLIVCFGMSKLSIINLDLFWL